MESIVAFAARLKPRIRQRRRGLPRLWLTTDAQRMPNPMAIVARLPRGSGVILRHPDANKLRALAEVVVPLCRRRKLICFIAGDWRLAARLGADGVHLSERMARVGIAAAARGWCKTHHRILTTAAHGYAAARRGARLGADAVLLAPVFATASHPKARTLGALKFAMIARKTPCPVIALGGITARTMGRLYGTGAAGLAGVDWASA